MKQVKAKKAKPGMEDMREQVKLALARKGARAVIIIQNLAKDNNAMVWSPAELDAAALELRHLAFQIHALQNAKLAVEEAVED